MRTYEGESVGSHCVGVEVVSLGGGDSMLSAMVLRDVRQCGKEFGDATLGIVFDE